ncbi:hypothetical protein BOTBODRAFT_102072 [Botryobasidium botryosum FD-172 SS1]|uniref:Leucine-rich repeat-containing N-terminal plant-type domain-containing protein n=1 Tax=Botryobasidium botryosum (strain FD-172 SS1) TaxID=930990 RepID=A0A067MZH1_BOTB1|nr:hypothetical protein BOTBODRAFT_102072 [Botryobasidium botryosum FD-172 SS1]
MFSRAWAGPSKQPAAHELSPWPPLSVHKEKERGWTDVEVGAGPSTSSDFPQRLHQVRHSCPCEQRHEKKRKSNCCWIIILVIIILFLLGNSIFLNIKTLSPKTSPGDPELATPDTKGTGTTTAKPSSSTSAPSAALVNCLSQFSINAPSSPTSYPCGTCVPIMAGVPNDLADGVTNPQTTGQGNALQFCALKAISDATAGNALQNAGWVKDVKFCGWNGVQCDSKGRVTALNLAFPAVPASLPTDLTSLIGLQNLQVVGDRNVPAGTIPDGLLSLPSLNTLHLESTAIQGPLPDNAFNKSSKLTSVTLVKNAQLGQTVPTGLFSLPLQTLIINTQNISTPLTTIFTSALASTLTTLDLSFNALTGALPSTLSSYNVLTDLHLDANDITALPAALPVSLKAFTIATNPRLASTIPAAVCSSSTLASCDFRGTQLKISTGQGNATTVCGKCLFG